jgi:hypothetical protein
VQTFYQPLFSNSPSAILFPSAIHFPPSAFSLQQFPFIQKAFPLKKPKARKVRSKNQKQKPCILLQSLIPGGKQGGAAVLGEGCDIVTRGTCTI